MFDQFGIKMNEAFHKINVTKPRRNLTKIMDDRYEKVKKAEDERELREEEKRKKEMESTVYRSAVTSRYSRKYSKFMNRFKTNDYVERLCSASVSKMS